jgi:hypothetical protein
MTRRTPLHDFCGLRLSRRTINALLAAGYHDSSSLRWSADFRNIRGLGRVSLAELRAAMVAAGWAKEEKQ